MPKRIQMSRQHPWRAEHPDAVIVARPSKWGNPYRIERDGTFMGEWLYKVVAPDREPIFAGGELFQEVAHRRAVERFQNAVNLGWYGLPTPHEIRAELAGRDLACWCPLNQPCHTDVLLELANGTVA